MGKIDLSDLQRMYDEDYLDLHDVCNKLRDKTAHRAAITRAMKNLEDVNCDWEYDYDTKTFTTKSRSDARCGQVYTATPTRCDCIAGQWKRHCWHLYAAKILTTFFRGEDEVKQEDLSDGIYHFDFSEFRDHYIAKCAQPIPAPQTGGVSLNFKTPACTKI